MLDAVEKQPGMVGAAKRLTVALSAVDFQSARWATVDPDDLRAVLDSLERPQRRPRPVERRAPFFASRLYVGGFLSALAALGLVVVSLISLAD